MTGFLIIMIAMNSLLVFNLQSSSIQDEISNDFLIRSFDMIDILQESGHRSRKLNDDGEEIQKNLEKKFVTISLGCNCQPSFNTRTYKIRGHAFPFDWCFTPYESLYHFINTDFKDYFKKENLVHSEKRFFKNFVHHFFIDQNGTEISESPSWVLDKENGMVFIHDFTDAAAETIEREHSSHLEKYLRRIKRFYNEINSGKYVYFIRFHAITKSQSIELFDLLKRKFPKVKFTLIVIGSNYEEFHKDWQIPHLKNLFAATTNSFEWKNLCKAILKQKLH